LCFFTGIFIARPKAHTQQSKNRPARQNKAARAGFLLSSEFPHYFIDFTDILC